MPSGGYRANAGRPKKSVTEKILYGNPGKRPIEYVDFDGEDELPKEPPVWLSKKGKEIYKSLIEWLEKIGCTKGILPYNLEEYAHCKSRWMEAEETINTHGLLVKDSNGKPTPNPYIAFAQQYLKMTNDVWSKIYQVVRETKLTELDNNSPNDDIMESLLRGNKC